MTLSMLPPTSPTPTHDDECEWAVVEIRRDGSLGRAEVVTALEPEGAARLARASTPLRRTVLASGELNARLGLALAAKGRLIDAGLAFTRVIDRSGAAADVDCEGHLALVEACRGNLRRASTHAERVLALGSEPDAGVASAHLALAWIQLERDAHGEAARRLTLAANSDARPEAWISTVRTLLEARLLLRTRPDSAVQLLAHGSDGWRPTTTHESGGWADGVLAVAHAEALLALGEPTRALTVLTPVPPGAVVEAGVTVAACRLAIGDVRGAEAVLAGVRDRLEVAALAVQLQAWLLEARIAEERGRPERVSQLVDRVLRSASWEDLRAPVRREWPWLRLQVERDHALSRRYRDFLGCFHDVTFFPRAGDGPSPTGALRTDEVLDAHLTQRETEVLDLLARMYSTDEIAATLFVSANTVKTHLKGIYAKLCVNRRADAVRRGRQLGIC